MKQITRLLALVCGTITPLFAQLEPTAGQWKTWFIESGAAHRLPAPAPVKRELEQIVLLQKKLTASTRQEITYWNAGAPGYHWTNWMSNLWMTNPTPNGPFSNMLLNVAIYDATIVAWNTKFAHKRPRPFSADKRIQAYGQAPDSPSYPCEHSVAAGAAATIIAHYFPAMADSAQRMANRVMAARVAAGMAFPSDTRAGFELGKRIAELELARTANYVPSTPWDGKRPQQAGIWTGDVPMFVTGGLCKPVVLSSSHQFRPGPPPDFAADMAELKAYKHTNRAKANAFFFNGNFSTGDLLNRKLFEHNLHLNPPQAARLYAAHAITMYDSFVAVFDAKYAYWGIRPDQYDPTYRPLLKTPPFPGYPSGHAATTGAICYLLAHFFPADRAEFEQVATDCAESRFQGGIHFRTDNEVGLTLGRNIADAVIKRMSSHGHTPY
ncbi:phosphatase PAP2 family protein [Fibrella forsythiae]|uniref:Phosphatase PAP2 family protein n=1 Tax=Fibrella forsythiae TaxID=2817061 RepID=A0ABS3JED1_9BACT|nr:phosphatase PAP2 family protein [Fibrella forsythiae]MBO0947806.1 phosphatase PAP2 family protein [Fibrella forsythiae]